MLVIGMMALAQTPQVITKKLQLNNVPVGAATDKVLVRGTDKIVKEVLATSLISPSVPQINSDWNATFGVSKILNRPNILTSPNFTILGENALPQSNLGSFNTAIGHKVMFSNTTGYSNTGVGEYSFSDNTTGARNTAIGFGSLSSNTISNDNIAIGFNALKSTTYRGNNLAIGNKALENSTDGEFNIAIGHNALQNVTTGVGNIAIGFNAAYALTSGCENTIIGAIMDGYNDSGSIFIGAGAGGTIRLEVDQNGVVKFSTPPPIYSTNATAVSADLVAGQIYRTSIGQLMIVY